MRNVLILGSGRSGTSMLAGVFAHAGWHVGADPYPARSSNPKGFFESKEINGVNEYLLALGEGDRLAPWQRWLAELPVDWRCPTDARAAERIRRLTQRAPYCFKDPRFSYTLPAWTPFTQDALRVCVFRHPLAVARSIVKECAQESYLAGVDMTIDKALSAWLAAHRRILDVLRADGEWCWVHYDQVLSGEAFPRLEALVGAPLARGFPDADLQRNFADGDLTGELSEIYAELLALSREGARMPPSRAPRVSAQRVERRSNSRAAADYAQELERWLECGIEGTSATWRALRGTSAAECERRILDLLPRANEWRASTPAAQRALAELEALESLAQAHHSRGTRTWDELEALAPWPISASTSLRVACWPQWTEAALTELLSLWSSHVPSSIPCALVLRHDAAADGDLRAALARLQRAYERCFDPKRELEVHVLGAEFDGACARRLARSVFGVLTLDGDARSAQLAHDSGARTLGHPEELGRALEAAASLRGAARHAASARSAII